MSFPWWKSTESGDSAEGQDRTRTSSNANSTSTQMTSSSTIPPVPGSPCLTFLKAPVVVQRRMGEKTGLLPVHRREPHASKQIKRCQLVAVVVLSLATAAVILFFVAGNAHEADRRR